MRKTESWRSVGVFVEQQGYGHLSYFSYFGEFKAETRIRLKNTREEISDLVFLAFSRSDPKEFQARTTNCVVTEKDWNSRHRVYNLMITRWY